MSENAALLLYGTQLKGSISAFETYASCRFAYFLEYGLKLSQREEYRFAVQDFGTVLHGVLEDVSRQLKRGEKNPFPCYPMKNEKSAYPKALCGLLQSTATPF